MLLSARKYGILRRDMNKRQEKKLLKQELATKKKILVLSAATENMDSQYKYTNAIKKIYCDRHGYDFQFDILTDPPNIAAYKKPHIIRKHLVEDGYDYVVWMDVDAWFNDLKKKLVDKIDELSLDDTFFLCCRDGLNENNPSRWFWVYINTGVLIFKNTAKSIELIDDWIAAYDRADLRRCIESFVNLKDQPFLCCLLLLEQKYSSGVSIVSPKEFNYIPMASDKVADPFIIHNVGVHMFNGGYEIFKHNLRETIRKNNLVGTPPFDDFPLD